MTSGLLCISSYYSFLSSSKKYTYNNPRKTKKKHHHCKQFHLETVLLSNNVPLLFGFCLLKPSGISQEKKTEERWKFDCFQSQTGCDKRWMAYHQVQPAVVISPGRELH